MIGKKIEYNGKTLYSPELFDNGLAFGNIFKDEDAFKNRPDDVCYIPEAEFANEEPIKINGDDYYEVSGYTRKDLEDMVMDENGDIVYYDYDGEPINIEYFFSELEWAYPETYLNERYC